MKVDQDRIPEYIGNIALGVFVTIVFYILLIWLWSYIKDKTKD